MKLLLAYVHLLFFLSLTATPPAIAKYAKTGCSDKCGNVRIPYPFGIGKECSINQWYIVDCKNSRPYLPALSDLEVLGVDLGNQTVTVSTPRITNCRNPFLNSSEIMGVDLGGSPFLFSKSHNTFVFKGCGAASLMADNQSAVIGCSTGCLNVTLGDRSNCFGIGGCCQIAIPHYLKSYSVMLTSLERQGNDGSCESAFMVDETSYDQGKFSDQFIVGRNNSFIPVSLLWTLTYSDQITCCYKDTPERLKVPMFDGTIVDTFKCNDYARSFEGNPYLIDGCTRKVKIAKYAKTGCNDTCGNVKIPFPFGIGVGCSINQWYVVDCNSSTPYLTALNHLELLGVNLEQQIVNVSMPSISYCQNPIRNNTESMIFDLGSSPFWFSNENNIFFFEGCGTAVLMGNDSVLTACSTSCRDVTLRDRYNCFGIGGCCQRVIPNFFKSYNIQFTGLKDGGCGSAFVVDKTSYDQRRLFDPFVYKNISSTRISLLWTLTDSNQVTCCFDELEKITVGIVNGTTVDTWRCYTYSNIIGNPYLEDGCDFDNGEDPTSKECRKCRHRGGYCGIERAYDVDGSIFSENFTCYDDGRISLGVILGVSISLGILFLVVISYILYKVIKKQKKRGEERDFLNVMVVYF